MRTEWLSFERGFGEEPKQKKHLGQSWQRESLKTNNIFLAIFFSLDLSKYVRPEGLLKDLGPLRLIFWRLFVFFFGGWVFYMGEREGGRMNFFDP